MDWYERFLDQIRWCLRSAGQTDRELVSVNGTDFALPAHNLPTTGEIAFRRKPTMPA